MSCVEQASCVEGDHTYSWPCDLAVPVEQRPLAGARMAELLAGGRAFLTQVECNGPHWEYVAEFRAVPDGESSS